MKFTAATNVHAPLCIYAREISKNIQVDYSPWICGRDKTEANIEIRRWKFQELSQRSFRLFNVLLSKHAENGIYCCWPHGLVHGDYFTFVRILRVNCRHNYNNNKKNSLVFSSRQTAHRATHPTNENSSNSHVLSFTQWTRSSLSCVCLCVTRRRSILFSFSFLFSTLHVSHSVGCVFLKI